MRRLLLILISFLTSAPSFAQDSADSALAQRIEILELKLQLAEQQINQLEDECESLRKENAKLKKMDEAEVAAEDDPFAVGVVWAGLSKTYGSEKGTPWAISISKRDGDNFKGAVATKNPKGEGFEFPVTGKAPRRGNGLVVMESPLMGRAKFFARGNLRNGAVALSFSGTLPFGKKFFGDATLSPRH